MAENNTTIQTGTQTNENELVFSSYVNLGIGLLAFLNNFLLIVVLVRNRQMLHLAYNIIIFALAVADMLTGLVLTIKEPLIAFLPQTTDLQHSAFGPAIKEFQGGLIEFTFGEYSLLLIMCLALERWCAVFRPVQYRYRFRKSRVFFYFVYIVITISCTNLPRVIPGYNPKSRLSMAFTIIDMIHTLIFPLTVTWVTYTHLWFRYRNAPSIERTGSRKLEQKLLHMCALTAVFVSVCWLPIEIYYPLYVWRFVPLDQIILDVCSRLALFNSVINPLIYYFTNQEYKNALKKLFRDIVAYLLKL